MSMGVYECLWVLMGIYEFLWVSWVFMGVYGYLSVLMGFWVATGAYGFLGLCVLYLNIKNIAYFLIQEPQKI